LIGFKNYPLHEVTCAYEAGFSGYSAARLFQKQNWNVLVLNAADIPKPQKQNVVKTYKIDCRNICKQLKNEALHSITIPEEQRESFRSLFRERNNFVEGLRHVKVQIKSNLMYNGFNNHKRNLNKNKRLNNLIILKTNIFYII
jgi:transposase